MCRTYKASFLERLKMPINKRFSESNLHKVWESLAPELRANVKAAISKQADEYQEVRHDCFGCGSDNFSTPLTEIDRYGFPYSVLICRACSHVQTNPTFRPQDYEDFYKNDYRQIYNWGISPDDFFREQTYRGKDILRFVEQHLPSKTGLICDYGCGAGGVLVPFRNKGYEVIGFDFDSDYLSVGKTKEGLDLRQGHATFQDKKPNVLILVHVLEHVLDLEKFFMELKTITSLETLIYVEVPSILAIWRDYGFDALDYFQNAHIHHFTRNRLIKLFEANGYGCLSSDYRTRAVFRSDNTVRNSQSATPAYLLITWFHFLEIMRPVIKPVFRLIQTVILKIRFR